MVMSLFHSVSDLIGHTPLLQLHKLDTGPCSLFLKLENQNPGGSIKDRVALSMINEAERQGKLAPGGTIIEATAGNTGLGLALIAAQKNYRLILVVPDKMSREKIFHLRALGATVLLTRSDVNKGHPAYYQDYARRLADETPGAFYIDQFNNDANPLAHATSTAPELYQQLEGDIDAIVVGVGSGGTLGGLQAWFAEHSPKTEFILADPIVGQHFKNADPYVAHIHIIKLDTITANHLSNHTNIIFGGHAVRLRGLFVGLLADSGNAAD